eukprot:g2540.t1
MFGRSSRFDYTFDDDYEADNTRMGPGSYDVSADHGYSTAAKKFGSTWARSKSIIREAKVDVCDNSKVGPGSYSPQYRPLFPSLARCASIPKAKKSDDWMGATYMNVRNRSKRINRKGGGKSLHAKIFIDKKKRPTVEEIQRGYDAAKRLYNNALVRERKLQELQGKQPDSLIWQQDLAIRSRFGGSRPSSRHMGNNSRPSSRHLKSTSRPSSRHMSSRSTFTPPLEEKKGKINLVSGSSFLQSSKGEEKKDNVLLGDASRGLFLASHVVGMDNAPPSASVSPSHSAAASASDEDKTDKVKNKVGAVKDDARVKKEQEGREEERKGAKVEEEEERKRVEEEERKRVEEEERKRVEEEVRRKRAEEEEKRRVEEEERKRVEEELERKRLEKKEIERKRLEEEQEEWPKVSRGADGIVQVLQKNGDSSTRLPDGTLVEMCVSDEQEWSKRQTSPDGTIIIIKKNGVRVQIMPNKTKIEIRLDKSTLQTNPNGNTIETFPNGDKVQTMANGTKIELKSDGTKIQHNPDKSSILNWPDGTRETRLGCGCAHYEDSNGQEKRVHCDFHRKQLKMKARANAKAKAEAEAKTQNEEEEPTHFLEL